MHDRKMLEKALSLPVQSISLNASRKDFEQACMRALDESKGSLDYYGDELVSAVKSLIADPQKNGGITLTDPRHNKLTGLSGVPIFFAAHAGKTIATVKAFCDGLAFIKTLWAQLNLARFSPSFPRATHVGRACEKGRDYYLLGSSFIEGALINDRVLALAIMADEIQRERECINLGICISQIGELLAGLHTAGKAYYGPLSPVVNDIHEHALQQSILCLQRLDNFSIDVDSLARKAKKIMHDMEFHEFRYAFVHGDAHPGNYLFHAERNQVYGLDVDAAAFSFAGTNEPRGSPFTDYIKFTASMKVRELFGIRPHETTYLRQEFDRGYQNGGGRLPSPEVENFYTLMEVFDYCAWYGAHESHLAPDVKAVMRSILVAGIGWLLEMES